MKKRRTNRKYAIVSLLAIGLVMFTGCPIDEDPVIPPDTRVILTAGSTVNVGDTATGASVEFTGATGLELAAADFTVSEGATVNSVSVSGDTATVTLTFTVNTGTAAKTYTVGISADSTKIKGEASVNVIHGFDERAILAAGSGETVVYTATTASVTFTGATGLTTLAAADFTASTGATVSGVSVTGDTATVTITFATNTGTAEKTYTVGISGSSTKIKGGASVTVTQGVDTRATLTAGSAVSAADTDITAEVTFTGATGLSLAVTDFTVDGGATVSTVSVSGGTATVTITFEANTGSTAKTYTVGISSNSTQIKGTASVTVTQSAYVDPRVTLTAGAAVSAAADATTADVSFTGATGLSLAAADFTVTGSATVTGVSVSGDTATVTITFAANTGTADITYTVGISTTSTKIKGTASVTVTQSFPIRTPTLPVVKDNEDAAVPAGGNVVIEKDTEKTLTAAATAITADPITYTWTITKGDDFAGFKNSTETTTTGDSVIIVGKAVGTATITVTAANTHGSGPTLTFKVGVPGVVFSWDYEDYPIPNAAYDKDGTEIPFPLTGGNPGKFSSGYGDIEFRSIPSSVVARESLDRIATGELAGALRIQNGSLVVGVHPDTPVPPTDSSPGSTSASTHVPGMFDFSEGVYKFTIGYDYSTIVGTSSYALRLYLNNNVHMSDGTSVLSGSCRFVEFTNPTNLENFTGAYITTGGAAGSRGITLSGVARESVTITVDMNERYFPGGVGINGSSSLSTAFFSLNSGRNITIIGIKIEKVE